MPAKYDFERSEGFFTKHLEIWKNNFIINSILKINCDFDIILIQEPSWTTIRSIPSLENCEGTLLVGIPNHPDWLTFAREFHLVL